jgi:hypothetical protein
MVAPEIKAQAMRHLKLTCVNLLVVMASVSGAFAQELQPTNCEMRFKQSLAIFAVSILLLAIDFPSAHALSSWDCRGWTVKLTNTCDNVFSYFHVCYGRNGEFGSENFMVPPTGGRQIHVQQYSTFVSSCGVIPSFICPAAMGPLPLDHCE